MTDVMHESLWARVLIIDSDPLMRSGSIPIIAVSALHIYLAILLFFEPLTANATNVQALVMAFKALYSPDGLDFITVMLILSALLAVAGTVLHFGYIRILLFLPQCTILGFSTVGGQIAAWMGHYLDGTGHYPDGSRIPWEHISADQVGYSALLVVYGVAVLRRCWESDGE